MLFIPFSATGVFYPIAPRGGRNPQHIYPLSAIARISRLPLRTKMVYGMLPQNIPDFTGELFLFLFKIFQSITFMHVYTFVYFFI